MAPEEVPEKASPPPGTKPKPKVGLSPTAANKWGNSLFARTSTPYSPSPAQLQARHDLEDSPDDIWAESADPFPATVGTQVETPVRAVKRADSGSSSDWSADVEENDRIRRELAASHATAAAISAQSGTAAATSEVEEREQDGESAAGEDATGSNGPVLMSPPTAEDDSSSNATEPAAAAQAADVNVPAETAAGAGVQLKEVPEGSVTPEETELPPAALAVAALEDVVVESAETATAVVQEDLAVQFDAPIAPSDEPAPADEDSVQTPVDETPEPTPQEVSTQVIDAAAEVEELSVQGGESVDAEVKAGAVAGEAAAAGGKKKPKKKKGGKK
jgi:hypothetical protein